MQLRAFVSTENDNDINNNEISRPQIGKELTESHSKNNLFISKVKTNHKKRNRSVFISNKKNDIE